MVASPDEGSGIGMWFSSFAGRSGCCFWVATTILGCFLGLSGVVGRALSMGLSAMFDLKVEEEMVGELEGEQRFELGWCD